MATSYTTSAASAKVTRKPYQRPMAQVLSASAYQRPVNTLPMGTVATSYPTRQMANYFVATKVGANYPYLAPAAAAAPVPAMPNPRRNGKCTVKAVL